ncbi:3-phosphoserine/phosphohydroxythreonine transaminase [Xylocopilactobacillus apis]|uniref:Phosphoserine aminotransferase n=1 Tax=Xylocopilactobacillus apis TaxID=2932183 RepID=A0AAU9DIV3_9LACO|nr:3-phosphoserine/phosphohydroxythreonine transaminase [Xylocopilactobacillus apis]BDR56727.1 phosphoserine aminotransferase [Xylocopilactobacillus apis]
MDIYNFGAGPAALPIEVKKQILSDLSKHQDDQLSILEISHRSAEFVSLVNHVEDTCKKIFNLDDDFAVLFLSGGATMQFALTPLNFAVEKKRVAFLNSGQFAERAAEQAEGIKGIKADFLGSTKDDHYQRLPLIPSRIDNLKYDYFHLTVNNTVEGTCYHPDFLPEQFDLPVVADMTSCLGEENFDLNKFQMVIASVQKNLGTAGTTIVLLRKSWAKTANLEIPTIMQYETFINSNSLINTPPVFPIYVTGKMLDWINLNGGIAEMDRLAKERANLLYDFLDSSKIFKASVKKSDRSLANVVFSTGDESKDAQIAMEAQKEGLLSIKGYRSFGGLRVSLYNGMPLEGVKELINFLSRGER